MRSFSHIERLEITALKRRAGTFRPRVTEKMTAVQTRSRREIIQLFRIRCISYDTPLVIILVHFSCEMQKFALTFR